MNRRIMMNRRKSLWSAAAAVVLTGGIAAAQKEDKIVNRKERSIALGEEDVKQLLLLMDTDKNGKISRQEYMNFMAAEFDRLDKDKSGELDVKELAQSQLRASRPAVGK
jgi:tRNA A37 methylthiotransferase MiaB